MLTHFSIAPPSLMLLLSLEMFFTGKFKAGFFVHKVFSTWSDLPEYFYSKNQTILSPFIKYLERKETLPAIFPDKNKPCF
jgi:hypothetical protein